MNNRIDDNTKDLLAKALESVKEDRQKLQNKKEQQAWRNINIPCTLSEALSNLTKNEMDKIRKNLTIKNVSALKKSELASELVNIIPTLFKDVIYRLDQERYDLVKKIVMHSGYIPNNGFPFSKIETLKEYSILFPGKYQNEKVLFMPLELMDIFLQIDGTELQKIVHRNTEWIKLTHGSLYYYGVIDSGIIINKIKQFTGSLHDIYEYFQVISFASNYYGQVQFSAYGLSDHRVFDKKKMFDEHKIRASIDYYPFTKKQLLKAGEPDYIEKTPAMNNMLQFLGKHYDLTKDKMDEIALQLTDMINMDFKPTMMMQYLQSLMEFPSFEFVQELTDKIMELHNHTRMWSLKGYTPQELSQEEKKHLKPLPTVPFITNQKHSKVVDIRNYTKAGRNDPCPCGSGKKYKKCCMK